MHFLSGFRLRLLVSLWFGKQPPFDLDRDVPLEDARGTGEVGMGYCVVGVLYPSHCAELRATCAVSVACD